jgi:type II secretory pathway component PulF
MLLEAGSNSGKLYQALIDASDAVTQKKRIKSAIVSNGAYPALLMVILVLALAVSAYNIIPTFAEVLPLEQWEGSAKTVAQMSMFIQANGLPMLLGFFVLVAVVAWSMPNWTGKTRSIVETKFPWSLYRLSQGSSFLLSVGSLMSSGVKIDDASLNRIARRSSPYLKERINALKRQISAGHNLGDALFRTGKSFPDAEVIDDLRIYATLKGFEDNLITITREWVEDVEAKVVVAMKVANFAALLLIAIVLGALISSLFSVVNQIKDAAAV